LFPSDIVQEHQSRKITPHRTGRTAHESPLPELSEKMSLQAGQISNLQQNFGSIQQEIKKVEESIMRLSTTLTPAESYAPPSFHGQGRIGGAPLRRSFEEGNFNTPNHMMPLRGSYQEYPAGGRMSFEESSQYGSFSPSRVPVYLGEVMTPSLKFAVQRLQDLHVSLQSEHHAAINELSRRRASLEERTRALQACDSSYFAAGQGSDAWLKAAEEGLHLRSDIELHRKEVELASERFHHVDERLKLMQSTLSSIQDTASRAQASGDLKSYESARQAIAAACSRLGVVVQEEHAPPAQFHPQGYNNDLRASMILGDAAAANFFMSPAEEERALHAQVTALNIEIDSIRRFARSKMSSPFAHDQDAARRSDAEVQVRQDRVRQLEVRLAQIKHDKPSSLVLTGSSLEDDLRARVSEKEAEIETVTQYLELLSKSGRSSEMPAIHAAQRDLAIKRAELTGLQTALNAPSAEGQVPDHVPDVSMSKHKSPVLESAPPAFDSLAASHGSPNPVRRLSPSDVAKLGQELRDIQGEIASMRRWAAAKRKSDSAVEQEAAARAEDAIALKEHRCEEIRTLLKPHETKMEEQTKAEVAAVSAEQLAEQERSLQMLKDLQAQLDLKNNEIEGLKNFARKKRQSVMPADQQIASKAERAIAEREAEVQALENTAQSILDKEETSSLAQTAPASPEESKESKRSKIAKLIVKSARDLKESQLKAAQDAKESQMKAAQEVQVAHMQDDIDSQKKELVLVKTAAKLQSAVKKVNLNVLNEKVRSLEEKANQEKAELASEYEGKLAAERARFEAERELFEQARAEMEERANQVKLEADELVERVRADGYQVLQEQRLEFEAKAADFAEKEQLALQEVTRLQTSARMKRKSLAPTDIMEANRLEEQARLIQLSLEDERSLQTQQFEVVKQASESLKDMVSSEQMQIVTRVEAETTQVELMKKFVSNKRKSVIPADQLAADQAETKIQDKENQLMSIMNTVAQQQSQVDFLIQTIQILSQNATNAHLVPGASVSHPNRMLSDDELAQRDELQSRIDQLNEELESVKEQHAQMMGFYNVKASSSREAEQLAAQALLSEIERKTEDIQSIEAEIQSYEEALQALQSSAQESVAEEVRHEYSGSSAPKTAADRSFEEQQEEVRLLREKLEQEEKAMEKMQKWVSHKRKSVLPADLKAADKAQEELDKAGVRVKMLRKSISGKLMNERNQGSEGKAKKKGIRFAGDEEDQENVVDDEVKISDETTEKMRAMEAEIEKLKKWISSKRASVLPADQQAASAAEQKVKARVAELAKIKEDADKELEELLHVKTQSLALDKENTERTLTQLQEERQQSQSKLQSIGKIVIQMQKFANNKRKSVLPADIEAAKQAESVIESKTAEVQALEEQIARSLALEKELNAKAAAADERMRALEERLANQEHQFEEKMQSFFSRKQDVLEPMVALPTDDPEALQRIAALLHEQSSTLRKTEMKKRQSVVASDLKEADSIARNIADLEKQEARIKDAMSKMRSQQYSDYASSASSNESPQVQAKRAEEVALRAHIENMRSWMIQKEKEQGNSAGLDIIRDTLLSKEDELAFLQEELLVLSGADMGKISNLRQELQMLRNPNLLLQNQEAQFAAEAELLAQNQEKVRAASLFVANKRKSVFPADHAQADEAESKLKILQQQVELQRVHLESQEEEMRRVRTLIERMQNPQFGHDEDELIDQGLAEARERTEQEIENMRAEVRQRRKSTFPADIARAQELEQLLAVKENERAEHERNRLQHLAEVENEREQARQHALRQQERISKLEKMLAGVGNADDVSEASELQARVSALHSEVALMQKWIQSKEAVTDASVLQPARDMLQQKMNELQSLQEQLDRPVSMAGRPVSLEMFQKFSFEIEHEQDVSVYPIGHSAFHQLQVQHDEALQNLNARPVPISVPGLESALYFSKEALPTKVSELQQLVLEARRLLSEREQRWQGREDAHNQVKRAQAQLLQQLTGVADKAMTYRGDACIAVGKYRERGNYLESRCQRVEKSLEEQQAKVEKQRNKVRELMKRLGGQNGRSQQDTMAVEQALSKKEKYKADLELATSELTDLRDKVVELETNLESSQSEILHARNEQERAALDFNRLASDCNQLRSALEGCISHISSHMRRSTTGSLSLTEVMSEMPMHPEDNEEWDPITAVVGDLLSQTKNILGLIHEASRSSYSAAAANEQAGLQRVNQALDSKLKEMERGLADKDNALKTAETHLAQAVEGLHAMQTASEAAIKHALSSKQREIDALKDKLRNALDNLNTMKSWVVEQHRQLDEEKHALKSELDEEKRSAEARRQEQDDIINTLNERIKRKSEELAAVTKRMRSLRERIVQLNWKDQSSRLLAARKVQVQVNCFFFLQILVIRPYHLFVAQDDDTGDEMDASPSLTGKNASELSGNRVRLTTYHVAHELF
jgi:hypothetical protein